MGGRSGVARCERCGRVYRPCRFNRHHQRYCLDAGCVGERRRERQRAHYARKYREDGSFQEAERERCRASLRERRAAPAVAAPEGSSGAVSGELAVSVGLPCLELVATGLVAQLIGSNDPAEVLATARRLEARGQVVAAVAAVAARGSPKRGFFQSVPRHSVEAGMVVPRHSVEAERGGSSTLIGGRPGSLDSSGMATAMPVVAAGNP